MAFEIRPNQKYALIAFSETFIDASFPGELDLGGGVWVLRSLPTKLPDHWEKWIGSIRSRRIARAQLIIAVVADSKHPEILDDENRRLQEIAYQLFWGFLLTGFFRVNGEPIRITGAHDGTQLDVRSIGEFEQPIWLFGSPIDRMTEARAREAFELARAIDLLPGKGKLARFGRVLHAFWAGILSDEAGNRLHEFIRCVEGFIYPDTGQTKRQFKSRTELFIGPRHHDLIDELYELRSAVEHLHDPLELLTSLSPRDRRLCLLQRAMESESLARYCIARLLSSSAIWPRFEDDSALEEFWKLDQPKRVSEWGSELDFAAVSRAFDSTYIEDADLGL